MAADLGGHADIQFVDEPPDSLVCLICTFIAEKPQQMDCCGKIYCEQCLEEHKKRREECPNCRGNGSSFDDKKSKREINALRVKCKHYEEGCNWTGQLSQLSLHLSTRCGYVSVSCKYAEMGCTERPLRQNLRKHEEDAQLHFLLATETITELHKKLENMEQDFTSRLESTERKFCTVHSALIRKLNALESKRTSVTFRLRGSRDLKSPHFYSSQGRAGYKMCIDVYPHGTGGGRGTHVSVFARLMKGDNDDSLTWPFTGTVTVELLNQLEDKNHHKVTVPFPADNEVSTRVVDGERGGGWGFTQFISRTDLGYKPDMNCQFLKDNTLIFRVSVQVPDYKPWLE